MASPWMGGPGRVGQVLEDGVVKLLSKKSAFFRQTAENSRVGAGMAADWDATLGSKTSVN